MEFLINTEELAALCGLPHLQQLAYLRGIKPYMDFKTGIVGIKRKVSHQSIAEQLYIEPHQGIKGGSISRQQVRRAIDGLERAGVIAIQSQGLQLIIKCVLANRDFSAQNKADTNPTQQAVIKPNAQLHENYEINDIAHRKADTANHPKADTPLINPLYISFLEKFERFWSLYPEKKSKAQAFQAFEALNPDDALIDRILNGLQQQIEYRTSQIVQNQWIPPWKYPANWLTQRCWEDEIIMEKKERPHASNRKSTRKQSGSDINWLPDEYTEDSEHSETRVYDNVYAFTRG